MQPRRTPSDIAERAALRLPSSPARCTVHGCGRPTQRAAGAGLSETLCRKHVAFLSRHGSAWARSCRATELRPYLLAARDWLKSREGEHQIGQVRIALGELLTNSGPAVSAYDLRGRPARDRARIALARLREAGVSGRVLLEITLAVEAIVSDKGPNSQEFVEVNIAKALHRKASGTHRSTSGYPMRSKYPVSAGRVLRVLGHMVWDVASIIANPSAVAEVVRLAVPKVSEADARATQRQKAEALVASEILRVSSFGRGPHRLAEYKRQLRRQHGLG